MEIAGKMLGRTKSLPRRRQLMLFAVMVEVLGIKYNPEPALMFLLQLQLIPHALLNISKFVLRVKFNQGVSLMFLVHLQLFPHAQLNVSLPLLIITPQLFLPQRYNFEFATNFTWILSLLWFSSLLNNVHEKSWCKHYDLKVLFQPISTDTFILFDHERG